MTGRNYVDKTIYHCIDIEICSVDLDGIGYVRQWAVAPGAVQPITPLDVARDIGQVGAGAQLAGAAAGPDLGARG
jgi:hypothetical protein